MVKLKFLETIVLGLSLSIPAAAEETEEYFTLISVADSKTTLDTRKATKLDTRKATKTRDLVEMVIINGKIKDVDSYEQETVGGYQKTNVVLKLKNRVYKIRVDNYSEREELVNWNYDTITILFSEEGRRDLESQSTFIDGGIDGRCNFGIVPDISNGVLSYMPQNNVGLENKEIIQKAYEKAIEDLTKFYPKKTR